MQLEDSILVEQVVVMAVFVVAISLVAYRQWRRTGHTEWLGRKYGVLPFVALLCLFSVGAFISDLEMLYPAAAGLASVGVVIAVAAFALRYFAKRSD